MAEEEKSLTRMRKGSIKNTEDARERGFGTGSVLSRMQADEINEKDLKKAAENAIKNLKELSDLDEIDERADYLSGTTSTLLFNLWRTKNLNENQKKEVIDTQKKHLIHENPQVREAASAFFLFLKNAGELNTETRDSLKKELEDAEEETEGQIKKDVEDFLERL